MTQEEKQLLLKEICARLPYGVKAEVIGWDEEKEKEVFVPVTVYSVNTDGYVYFADNDYDITSCSIDACRLYLRPISSMTSKEWVEFCDCSIKDEASWVLTSNRQKLIPFQNREDYLNSKHFDYRGLIPMGLALEAPEGMYKQ